MTEPETTNDPGQPGANPPHDDADTRATLAALEAELASRDVTLAEERARYGAAVGRLKTALAASEPGLDAALIAGETIEEAETSFAAAREVLRRVRDDVRREAAAAVPAGAPGRLPAPRLTSFEKIRAGIGRLS